MTASVINVAYGAKVKTTALGGSPAWRLNALTPRR